MSNDTTMKMNNIRKISGLLFCLISFLMANQLQGQTQYEVSVVLGLLDCEASGSGTAITLSGTVGAGPSTDRALAQEVDFNSVPNNVNYLIFRRTFDYLPTYLTYANISNDEAPGVDCGDNIADGFINITQSHSNLGGSRVYTTTGDTGESLSLIVSIVEKGVSPGEIGPNQIICNLESPSEIRSIQPASGASGFEYRWQYSDNGTGSWVTIMEPGRGGRNTFVTTASYTPGQLANDRYFRRAVLANGSYTYSNNVKITVNDESEERYQFDFFLSEYSCSGVIQDNVRMEVEINLDGQSFSVIGVVNEPDEPLISTELEEMPSNFTLSIGGLLIDEGPYENTCSGILSDSKSLGDDGGALRFYTITNESGEELKYILRITSQGTNTIPPGEIGSDQEICVGDQPSPIVQVTAPDGGLVDPEFIWEYTTDGGFNWSPVGASTQDFGPGALTETTWYRRKVKVGCLIGTSNVVKITVLDLSSMTIIGIEGPYETSDAAVNMTGTPVGGTFSGPGVTGSSFSPAAAGTGIHTIIYTYVSPSGCEGTATVEVEVLPNALCTTIVPLSSEGHYELDKFSGQIVFIKDDGCAEDIALSCIVAKPAPPTIQNVVSASAATLSDEWAYESFYNDRYETTLANANDFEKGVLGQWRSVSSYGYNTSEITRDKNYNTGTFELPVFNWEYESANNKDHWILASRTEKYSPNGEALEEFNAIDIPSAVKMGYHGHLPYLTAQNAIYESVFFESFEMDYDTRLESGASYTSGAQVDQATGHAGFKSLLMSGGDRLTTSLLSLEGEDKKMMIQAWVKGDINEPVKARILNGLSQQQIVAAPMVEIARSGDWGLYQAVLSPGVVKKFQFEIKYTGANSIRLDDVRIQPEDAEMTCYVYDEGSLKVLTVFDGQHFGLYYQYDGEGKLVRKTIETERGTRTLQETFYNIPKSNK